MRRLPCVLIAGLLSAGALLASPQELSAASTFQRAPMTELVCGSW